MEPTTILTRNGQRLTAQAWSDLDAVARALELPALTVVQGSHKGAGGGAAASGSTHDAGDTADIRVWDLPTALRVNLCEPVVVKLREHGWCAWLRDAQHGGMDPHIHAVYRFASPALSSGARSQVSSYDRGRNGLSNDGPDYHPRPRQTFYPMTDPGEDDDMPTAEEIAAAVWSHKITDPVNGETVTARTLLARTRTVGTQGRDAAREAAANTRPTGSRAADTLELDDVAYDDPADDVDDVERDPARCRE